MGLEQIIDLTGHIGKDAELRTTPNGKSVADFSLATTDRYDDSTVWWKITIWGKLAESVTQYLTKGTQVRVRGSMTYPQGETYVNNAGETVVANYAVTARDLQLLGGGMEASPKQSTAEKAEIPF